MRSHLSTQVIISIVFITVFSNITNAQVAWLFPDNPSINDTVTLTFNTNSGNEAMADFDGPVYFHTGAITDRSIDGGDWKHIVGNWGEDDKRVIMQSIGNGLHENKFVISIFYNLRDDENIQQLAFVFRNKDGSKVGKTVKNEDIFIPVNGYKPPPKAVKEYKFENRKYISHFDRDSVIDILTNHGITQIISYNKNIFEVVHFPKSFTIIDSSHSVIMNPINPYYNIINNDSWLRIRTDSLSLAIHKDPFYVAFIYNNDTIVQEERGFFTRTDTDGLRFKTGDNEKLFGLGERSNALDLVGNSYKLYNRPKYGYEIGAKNLNYSIPLVVSSNKYLLLFDNPQKGNVDIGESEKSIIEWTAIGGTMKYFVVAGSNFKIISNNYGKLTGTQPLPPIWALGNMQSRMGYRTQTETDSIVSLTLDEDFPLDAMIIDLYWFGDSLHGTMGRLDWYKPNWPEPEKMISDFRKKGVKTILITEPYILDSLANYKIADSLEILALDSNGNSYVNREFYFGDGALLDIFKPEAGNWFWTKYKAQMDIGVEGWWGDLGEPENHPSDQIHIIGKADEVHNIYGHYWHKALFENFRKDFPNRRLFNLNRAGFAGSQRYSIYPWTGDVSRSWGGLQAQIPLLIHMSLSGLPFIHSDAGGFAQGALDNELYTRWLQMACFSPILRPHGSGIPSEPVYFNDTTKSIVRNFMKIRYQLLPYFYTLSAEAKLHGYPIVRPLFYEFPDDTTAYSIANEYMLGDDILIAPVVERGQVKQELYLPKGKKWYNFWNNFLFDGGKTKSVKIDLETIPIFVKSGSFIPMVPYFSTTDNYTTRNLTFRYYFDHSSITNTYTMFEDDGSTYGTIESGEYRLIVIKRKVKSDGEYSYTLESKGNGYNNEPVVRNITIEIIGLNKSNIDSLYNNDVKMVKSENKTESNNEYYYDHISKKWILNLVWDGSYIEITQKGKIK